MASETINPDVGQTLADMDGERIEQRSSLDFPRHFWSALKNGHYRFALQGVALAIPIAAAVGAAVCGVIAATVATTTAMALAPLIIPAFIAAGGLMAIEGFGAVGSASASRASGLAEKHARILDADAQAAAKGRGSQTEITVLQASADKLMYDGRGHHYEFPDNRDKGKWFNWKSGVLGSLMGAASGAVLGMGFHTLIAEIPAVAAVAGHLAGAAGLTAAAATAPMWIGAGALAFGVLGLYFGVERKVVKSFFNQTDANIQGKLRYTDGPDLGRQQSQESDYDLAQHRLRRQAEIAKLEKEYNERITGGALGGRFKGFAGVVPGLALGAVAGVIALGALALIPGGAAIIAAHSLTMILPALFASAGGVLGMNTFAESATEAGAEATARAIDTEFERNRALRKMGITPDKPKEVKENWYSPKTALICGAIGAAVGIPLAVWIGPPALAMAGIAHAAAYSAASIATSATVCGLIGSTYGLGAKSLNVVFNPVKRLYDKFNSRHDDKTHEHAITLQLQPGSCVESQITPEEMAVLNQRLSNGNGKSFSQMTQQLQPIAATVGV